MFGQSLDTPMLPFLQTFNGFLLGCKTSADAGRMLNEVKQLIPQAALVDFERAAINAFSQF